MRNDIRTQPKPYRCASMLPVRDGVALRSTAGSRLPY
jgi:hypothetical protein